MDWDNVFEEAEKVDAATHNDIAYLQESALAQANASQWNPMSAFDPFHDKYQPFVEFLQWSNGGHFVNADREFGVLDPRSIRECLLSYQLPECMAGAVPFVLDGGGGFYVFDMRNELVDGEFPIVFVHSGSLGWNEDDYIVVANTFAEACQGKTNPLH